MTTPAAASASAAASLPLLPPTPPANCTARLIPLTQTVHRSLRAPACFALLIENALTPSECRSLLTYATSRSPWEAALINTGLGTQALATDVRNSSRLILDSPEVAGMLLARVRPFLEAEEAGVAVVRTVGTSKPGKRVWDGMRSHWLGPRPWRLTRLNERLRFLKYGPGQYFKPHCDGSYITPDGRERSLLTFHSYLGENDAENVGGSTRFFGDYDKTVADVEPVQGRVLVFQHQWLIHSGEEMERGVKYTLRTDVMYEEAPELDFEEEGEEFQHYKA
ncbi:hypothetical protein BZA05DRAFT_436713 [Tricharina praecox]|uniref:uncharacterized protein n=1 Tax=Tricharina praecox TaxID=43433 RepID=UPI002220C186|nr:uncharacterized protein BZA05DRAFT_436713 [Tricharina praecox]KAI5850724.1 hypothetical protein BZA05DRAFT_436713 [Tricharina praecox]